MGQSRRTMGVLMASCLWVAPLSFAVGCGSDHEHPDDGHHDDHHGDDGHHSHGDPVGPPSGAMCPESSTLTYENFGEKFFADYCLRCHSSSVSGNAREGAPADHNFDTYDEIELMADHIDQTTAFGPDSENDKMPFNGKKPTDEERRKLGEWLACGLKE